jgi:signal transduction histidine kinase/ActR/RegA family two-component response regulator
MLKFSHQGAPGAAPAVGALDAERDLRDEAAALRQLLLELRPDLPRQGEPGRESNRARFAEALAALGELAISTEELGPLTGQACSLVAETLDVDAVAVLEPDHAADALVVRAACGCLAGARGERAAAGAGTQAGFALGSRCSTATADARATWTGDDFLSRHQLVAAALAVLPSLDGPRALLGAYQLQRRAFSPDEVRFLEAAASTLSAAVARSRAEAEREELHSRLALADRMVSVGTLAAGVAHELNNPLAYVTANISFLLEQVGHLTTLLSPEARDDGEVSDVLQQLCEAASDTRDGVDRMRTIVRDLRTLSRAEDDKIGPLDLNPVLESCVTVAFNELKHRARLVKDLAPLPAVRGNEGRLGQVFLNLLINAAQAIPDGQADRQEIRVTSRPLGTDRVAIEVKDTGCGVKPEHLSRIFDPFFTTKPPGVGTGLGLSISLGIVSGMGGTIEVESQPGQGATFRVVLPVVGQEAHDDHPADAPAPADAPQPGGGDGPPGPDGAGPGRSRVLVVDDEPLVRTVVSRTLGREHEIVTAASAREALERLARGEGFDLVLSDLQMPGQTGMDLHAELTRVAPELARRMIFLSGGAYTEEARAFLEREGVECLEKPFDLDTLRAVVASRLAPGAA